MKSGDSSSSRRVQRPGARAIASVCTYTLLVLWAAQSTPAGDAAPPSGVEIPSILKQSKEYVLRFRDGDPEAAAANVALLEEATAAEAGNADLWHAMGLAYVNLAARAGMPGGQPGGAVVALQKGMPALNRALQVDPDHAEALSLRAGMRAMIGLKMNAPDLVSQAIADMNRAADLAPDSASVRLVRAFGAPVMPEALRNRVNEASDLDFLIEASEKSRAGNFMSILRADLYFENGEVDSARQLYELVNLIGAASAAQLAMSRLALLPQGRDAMMKDIMSLRATAGTQCIMCHGRENALAID